MLCGIVGWLCGIVGWLCGVVRWLCGVVRHHVKLCGAVCNFSFQNYNYLLVRANFRLKNLQKVIIVLDGDVWQSILSYRC